MRGRVLQVRFSLVLPVLLVGLCVLSSVRESHRLTRETFLTQSVCATTVAAPDSPRMPGQHRVPGPTETSPLTEGPLRDGAGGAGEGDGAGSESSEGHPAHPGRLCREPGATIVPLGPSLGLPESQAPYAFCGPPAAPAVCTPSCPCPTSSVRAWTSLHGRLLFVPRGPPAQAVAVS